MTSFSSFLLDFNNIVLCKYSFIPLAGLIKPLGRSGVAEGLRSKLRGQSSGPTLNISYEGNVGHQRQERLEKDLNLESRSQRGRMLTLCKRQEAT